MKHALLFPLLFLSLNFIFAQSNEGGVFKYRAFETSLLDHNVPYKKPEWTKTDVLIVINYDSRKLNTYGNYEKDIDLVKIKDDYIDNKGGAWAAYVGVDESGKKCTVSFKVFKVSESSQHMATLMIDYPNFTMVFRLMKNL